MNELLSSRGCEKRRLPAENVEPAVAGVRGARVGLSPLGLAGGGVVAREGAVELAGFPAELGVDICADDGDYIETR